MKAGKIAKLKLEEDSIDYIIKLMHCSMSHSLFHEPEGIFKTLEGFSMGDNSAANLYFVFLNLTFIKRLEIHGASRPSS